MALKKAKKKEEEGSKRMRFLFFGVPKVAQSGLEKPIWLHIYSTRVFISV